MGRIKTVFLDIDGVIADFTGMVIKFFGLHGITDQHLTYWDAIMDIVQDNLGLSHSEFWEAIPPEQYLNMDFTIEAEAVFKLLDKYGLTERTCLLTSPPWGMAGIRQEWIRNNLPEFFHNKQYLIGPGKWFAAHPGALLIDDYDKNVRKFKRAWGQGIIFPRPWNGNRNIKDPVAYLDNMLQLYRVLGKV